MIQCKDEMYGYFGGLFGKILLWMVIDGVLVCVQLNYQVKDLGIEFIMNLYLIEGKKYLEVGVQWLIDVQVKMIDGVCVVVFIYEMLIGWLQFYVKKEVLGFDLYVFYFWIVEFYDNDGKIFEWIVIEKIVFVIFDDIVFDLKNFDYVF